eukprot:gene10535-biopygen5232
MDQRQFTAQGTETAHRDSSQRPAGTSRRLRGTSRRPRGSFAEASRSLAKPRGGLAKASRRNLCHCGHGYSDSDYLRLG